MDNEKVSIYRDIPSEEDIIALSDLFKVFGDSTRLKILSALSSAEMCVGDIAQLIQVSESAVSHQLRILRQAKLIKQRRQGREMHYSLLDSHVETIIAQGFGHIKE